MPTVPVYGDPKVAPQALPNVPVGTDAPLEAFGGGASAARLTEATINTAKTAGDVADKIAADEKRKGDQVAFLAADRQASELQTKLQVDTSKMRGQDAFGAPDYVGQEWKSGVDKIRRSLANDDQRMAFDRSVNGRYEQLNKTVQFHVADQSRAVDETETSSYLKTSRNAAAMNAFNDGAVDRELNRQRGVVEGWAKRNGVYADKDGGVSQIYQAKLADELSSTHMAVIQARLDAGNDASVSAAKNYFSSHKGEMTAEQIVGATKILENADNISVGNSVWNQVSGYKLSDGQPDENKMRSQVMALPSLSDDRKEKIWSFVKARAGEAQQNKNRQEAANDREFMNNAVDARKKGLDLTTALKLADHYGTDDYDQSIKAEAIKKIYAPPSQSDPGTFIGIWERVQDSKSSKQEIDSAFQANALNPADWRTLREDYYRVNTEGKSTEEKATWERVKSLADEKFGSNKVNRENFLYELHSVSRGKPPEELWKIANDKLKTAPGSGIFGTDWWGTAQWKPDLQRMDAQNLAWGKAYQDIGKQEVMAIGKGALYSGKESWGLGDVDAFAASFGGYDKVKAGTPAHNAVQSLIRRNQLVTPSNVKAVLDRYPDGRY